MVTAFGASTPKFLQDFGIDPSKVNIQSSHMQSWSTRSSHPCKILEILYGVTGFVFHNQAAAGTMAWRKASLSRDCVAYWPWDRERAREMSV